MTLREFDAALKARCSDVYELAAPKGLQQYAVWHKYGVQHAFGDDRNAADLPRVQIDILSQQNDSIYAEDICAALWGMDIPYMVVSDGYDPDYNAYRTILQLVVI